MPKLKIKPNLKKSQWEIIEDDDIPMAEDGKKINSPYQWNTQPQENRFSVGTTENVNTHGNESIDIPTYLKAMVDVGGVFNYPLSVVGAGIDAYNGDYVGAVMGLVPIAGKSGLNNSFWRNAYTKAINNGVPHTIAKPIQKYGKKSIEGISKSIQATDLGFDLTESNNKKQNGGSINKYPNGGRQPIIVNDKNDPRLQAYSDSLDLYNFSQLQHRLEPTIANWLNPLNVNNEERNRGQFELEKKAQDLVNNNPNIEWDLRRYAGTGAKFIKDSSLNPNIKKGYKMNQYYPEIWKDEIEPYYTENQSPDLVHKTIQPSGSWWGKGKNLDYKKPVQPIIYQPTVSTTVGDVTGDKIAKSKDNVAVLNSRLVLKDRQKDPTLQLNQGQQLLPESSKNINFNPIPYEQGTYFSRPRQQQEIGGTEYFDKKTGKPLSKFQDGGSVKLKKEEVLRAVQQAEEANRSKKYEPTQIVNKNLQNVKNKYVDQAYEFTDNHYPVNQFEENGHNDYVDALRHAGTAMYMTAGQGKWAAPFKVPYTNIMGVANEIKGLGDYLSNTKSKTWEGTKQQFKETGSDLYNNFIGSIIGGLPTDIENKEKVLRVAKDYGVLSDLSKKKNGGSAPMAKNGSTINNFQDGGKTSQWEILDEAQNGVKIKPKYEWSNQQTTNPSITTQGNNNVSRTEGNRKLTKQETEQLAKYTEIQNQLNKEKEYNQRKQNIQQSNQAQSQPLSAENLRTQTQATGDKLSFAMNSKYGDPNQYPVASQYMDALDEINPAKYVGDMASGLGAAWDNVNKGNYGQAALAIGTPLAVGALAGMGTQGTKQFVNELANPFAGMNFRKPKFSEKNITCADGSCDIGFSKMAEQFESFEELDTALDEMFTAQKRKQDLREMMKRFESEASRKTPKMQDGGGVKDKYNTTINSKIVNSNESRSRYDSRFNEILLGEDYKKATPEQQERMVAHEGFHSKQFADGKSRFIEYKDIPYKRPSIVSTDENYDNYHNRKQVESDIDINNFTNQNPSFKFVPKQLVFNNIVDNQQYDNPYSLEGEATYYENSGEIPPTYQNGGNTRGTLNINTGTFGSGYSLPTKDVLNSSRFKPTYRPNPMGGSPIIFYEPNIESTYQLPQLQQQEISQTLPQEQSLENNPYTKGSYYTIKTGSNYRNPETQAFEPKEYLIDKTTGKRLTQPKFQSGGNVPIPGTKQQYENYTDSLNAFNLTESFRKLPHNSDWWNSPKLRENQKLPIVRNETRSTDRWSDTIVETPKTKYKNNKPKKWEKLFDADSDIVEYPVYQKPIQPIGRQQEESYTMPKLDLESNNDSKIEFNTIPFEKGSYFSVDKNSGFPDRKQQMTDYYNKKTGKKLGTYPTKKKSGGKVNTDWEIVQD